MNTSTLTFDQKETLMSKKFKSTMTTVLYFGLLYGSAFAFIALTSFTWINFKSIY